MAHNAPSYTPLLSEEEEEEEEGNERVHTAVKREGEHVPRAHTLNTEKNKNYHHCKLLQQRHQLCHVIYTYFSLNVV